MRKLLSAIFALFLVAVAAPAAWAGEYGSLGEAKAMTEKAAVFFKANGAEKAFAAFTEGSAGFKDRDLYVFVYDQSGTCVAHGANKALVGKSLINLKDVDGKEMIREIVSVKTTGTVDFKWANPQTKAVAQKHAYVVHAGDYWFGVGAYDQK
jgi:cytochrome c